MKAVRLENFGTKTPPGKSAEEWRRKKKNLTNTGWSSAPAESGETSGKDTGAAGTPPERRPTYSETMQGYYLSDGAGSQSVPDVRQCCPLPEYQSGLLFPDDICLYPR